jgi:hypothetical protein
VPIPSHDEAFVLGICGCGVTGQKVPRIWIPFNKCQMRVGSVRTVCQKSLEISPIMLQLCGRRDLYAAERNATLTEQRMKKIISSGSEIRRVEILSVCFD